MDELLQVKLFVDLDPGLFKNLAILYSCSITTADVLQNAHVDTSVIEPSQCLEVVHHVLCHIFLRLVLPEAPHECLPPFSLLSLQDFFIIRWQVRDDHRDQLGLNGEGSERLHQAFSYEKQGVKEATAVTQPIK